MSKTRHAPSPEKALRDFGWLAKAIARNHFGPGLDQDDLEQEGLIAIWGACRSFRPGRGTTFETFVGIVIRRRIIDAVKRAQRGKHSVLNGAAHLDSPVDEEGSRLLHEEIPDRGPDVADQVHARHALPGVIHELGCTLTDLEAAVLAGFLNDQTYAQIAEDLDCTTQSVDNALQRARRKAGRVLEERWAA